MTRPSETGLVYPSYLRRHKAAYVYLQCNKYRFHSEFKSILIIFTCMLLFKSKDQSVGQRFPGEMYTQFGLVMCNVHRLRNFSPYFEHLQCSIESLYWWFSYCCSYLQKQLYYVCTHNQNCSQIYNYLHVKTNYLVNTLGPRQNGRHFSDDTFKWIFLNENVGFRLIFHWHMFLGIQLIIFQHWFT